MKKQWNNKGNFNKNKNFDKTPRDEGCKIYVRNGDVNGAIRRLKKILERDNRQKELAKREYYEKPSAKRKRQKAQGVKKAQKSFRDKVMRGEALPPVRGGQKHLKGKRSLNKYRATKRLLQQRDWARK